MNVNKTNFHFSARTLIVAMACVLAASGSIYMHQVQANEVFDKVVKDKMAQLRNKPASKETQLLLAAVEANKRNIIEALIADGFDIDGADIGNGTPLIMAVKRQNIAMAQYLLELGANPNASSLGDGSALIMAVANNNLQMVEVLLQAGADPNLFVAGDETPLIQAARNGNLEMVQRLLNSGAVVGQVVDDDGEAISAIDVSYYPPITQLLKKAAEQEVARDKKLQQIVQQATPEIENMLQQYQLPSISIAVNVEGKVLWQQAFGFADIAKKLPATVETPYAVGSIAKPMTSIAMARLIAQDKLKLESSIGNYADYPEQLAHLTVKQLASHTAGIVHYNDKRHDREFVNIRDHDAPSEAMDIFSSEPLLFVPGIDFKYSSSGYILLSDVLAKAAGQDYLRLMREEVFAPLNMTATELDNSTAGAGLEATYYQPIAENGEHALSEIQRDRSFLFGGGGFISTPSDLVNMAWGMQQKHYLAEENFKLMASPVSLTNGAMNPQNYALGWRVHEFAENMLAPESAQANSSTKIKGVHHGGTVADAASAYLLTFPESKVSIAFATNTIPSKQTQQQNIRMDMWKLLYRFHRAVLDQ